MTKWKTDVDSFINQQHEPQKTQMFGVYDKVRDSQEKPKI